MTKARLYLFVGFPGAGKTTVANLIADCSGAVHLWADQERQAMFETVTHSKQESDELYDKLNQRADELLAAGKSVVFDTNFNYLKDRQYLCSIAAKNNAEVTVIWMQTPIEIARDRALHEHHRDRNGYDQTMTAEEFERLTNHVEPPSDNENFITIDGTDIDTEAVKRQLGL